MKKEKIGPLIGFVSTVLSFTTVLFVASSNSSLKKKNKELEDENKTLRGETKAYKEMAENERKKKAISDYAAGKNAGRREEQERQQKYKYKKNRRSL